jgi:methionyl aminopeptidase
MAVTHEGSLAYDPIRNARISGMRRAGVLARLTRNYLMDKLHEPDMTTGALDNLARTFVEAKGGRLACEGYEGYPRGICVSINDEACHGVPDDNRRITPGSIVTIDLVIAKDGVMADTAATAIVQHKILNERWWRLLNGAYACMAAGIEVIRPGTTLAEVGRFVERMAKSWDLTVLRRFAGHGIGYHMHEWPTVPMADLGEAFTDDAVITPGMTFTIEPIVTFGHGNTYTGPDGWTEITEDMAPCAQFEHTVLINASGYPEVLT